MVFQNTKQMIIALPVHNISNICYTKEADNSHIVAIQSGDYENDDFSEVTLVVVKTKVCKSAFSMKANLCLK